ncbi:MAG TPA: sugar ABC transporter ATP-binding protein [Verrucomicrobiae bacterium]|nr:sugar ABC transporter ATP-binding protein [Verrucomicrobiae bacterium]
MPPSSSNLEGAPLLSLRGIVKRFGGVTALSGVDFDLRAGEIHALLGENGAGKSTLIKILGGIHQPDSGEIQVDGRRAVIHDVADADRAGIRMIHQELSLASNLSVAENIFLGREPTRMGWLNRRQLFADAEALINELDLPEIGSVRTPVSDLSVARQQMVEIARALSVKARILVLDEPTASISEAETEALFVKLRKLSGQGVGIIYISHRLEEIQRLAHRITVLRDGRSVGTQSASEMNQRELIRFMVGRDLKDHYPRPEWKPGAVALTVRNLSNSRLKDVTFELRYGEILGFAGLVGAGRTELARALFGIDPLDSGEILVEGRRVNIRCVPDALKAGFALVPENRKQQGLVMTGSVAYNLALPWTQNWIKGCRPSATRRNQIVARAIKNFGIRVSDHEQSIGSLSGGNQQKVVVGKWMECPPKILILDEPTRGVDVGAREEMFGIIHRVVEQGMAVLLISSDLPEVMNLSHRLALFRDGRIIREVPSREITAEEVMGELTRN